MLPPSDQPFMLLLVGFDAATIERLRGLLPAAMPFDVQDLGMDWGALAHREAAVAFINCCALGVDMLAALPAGIMLPVLVLVEPQHAEAALALGAWDHLAPDELTASMLTRALRYLLHYDRLERQLDTTLRHFHNSEARFRHLLSRNADSIIVVDWDGVIHFVNAAAEELFERRADTLVGTSLGFPVSSGDVTELEILQRSDEIAVAEMRVMETEWAGESAFLLSLRPVGGDKSDLDQIVRRNYQFATAITNLSVGVIITDPKLADNPIIFANAGFTKITGYTIDEAMGRNCRFLQGPDTNPQTLEQLRSAVREGRAFNDVLLNYRKDGTPFWNELRITPVFDGDGQLISFVGLQNDITPRKEAEEDLLERERLRVALEKERELGQVKNVFMSTISHEFRTPLAIIHSASEMLERYLMEMSEERRIERLGNIKAQVKHLEDMLDEVAIVIQAETGRLEFHPKLIDMVPFCRDLVESYQIMLTTGHQIAFHTMLTYTRMSGDPRLLRHIFTNLLSNAVKYSAPEQPIHLSLRLETGAVVVEIRDHGIGIPKRDQGRLFEPFFRASNVGAIEGTGLGLKVVRDCVDLHGGTVTIRSAEGEGTTSIVRLPMG